MKKIKLTRKWKKTGYNWHEAIWKKMELISIKSWNYRMGKFWIGKVSIGEIQKIGPRRRSIESSKQDAERLAVELLLDIRDGAKILMDKYGIGEDD